MLDVGSLLGLTQGGNPHQWYSPASLERVIAAITADYSRLDPRDAGYFEGRRRRIRNARGWPNTTACARRSAPYAGVPVGYSESIFGPLGASLGLELMTPYSFAKAVSEGTDVSAQDKQTIDRQAQTTRSRCGSTTARTRRPTCSGSTSSPAKPASR